MNVHENLIKSHIQKSICISEIEILKAYIQDRHPELHLFRRAWAWKHHWTLASPLWGKREVNCEKLTQSQSAMGNGVMPLLLLPTRLKSQQSQEYIHSCHSWDSMAHNYLRGRKSLRGVLLSWNGKEAWKRIVKSGGEKGPNSSIKKLEEVVFSTYWWCWVSRADSRS